MLVLSRQLDESIMIGDDIVITVVDIRGDKVRLGIAAPSKIQVHRQEVYESIQRETMQAAFVEAMANQQMSPAALKPMVINPRSFKDVSRGSKPSPLSPADDDS